MKIELKKIAPFILLSLFYMQSSFANCCFVNSPSAPNGPPILITPYPPGGGGSSGGGGIQYPNAIDQEIQRFNSQTMSMMNQHHNMVMQQATDRLNNAIENFKKIEEMGNKSREEFANFKPLNSLDEFLNLKSPNLVQVEETSVQSNINGNQEGKFYISPFLSKGPEKTKQEFIKGIQSPRYSEAEREIEKAVEYFVREKTETDIRKKNEINQVVGSVLNENGFVSDYVIYYPKLQNYSLKTKLNSENSHTHEITLKTINKALHIVKNSYSPSSIEKAEVIIENSLKADIFSANGLRTQANRLLDRGYSSLIYYQNRQDKVFAKRSLSLSAKRLFDVDENIKATTSYENYQIIQLANGLARELNRNNELTNGDFYTLSHISLKQVQESATHNDLKGFEADLDHAWLYADVMSDVTKGVARGVYQVAEDTVTGVYQLVTHPIDSVTSIYSAIENYDKTYEVISNKIKQDIDNFPNLSVEEKAKLITQSSIEIATLVTPRGLVKNTAELNKIAKASTYASTKVVEHYAKVRQLGIPPRSSIIPSGDLFNHENFKGGHTIRKHVGLETTDLVNRSMKDGNPKVSTFPNLTVAQQAIESNIIQNKTKIDNWLNNLNADPKNSFSSQIVSNNPTGIMYDKVNNKDYPVYNTKVVLAKDNKFEDGYRIITSFPIE